MVQLLGGEVCEDAFEVVQFWVSGRFTAIIPVVIKSYFCFHSLQREHGGPTDRTSQWELSGWVQIYSPLFEAWPVS